MNAFWLLLSSKSCSRVAGSVVASGVGGGGDLSRNSKTRSRDEVEGELIAQFSYSASQLVELVHQA
jgi:hypothetical protein